MLTERLEKNLALIMAIILAGVILIVTTFMSIEPVNTPKALLLFPAGLASWGIILQFLKIKMISNLNWVFALLILFSCLALVNPFFSSAPVTQTLYGTFGRSTGVFTYLSLAGILGFYAALSRLDSFKFLVLAIFISGIINVVYCGIDLVGPDILGWNNQYGEILGTLGNPNFIGAFLGLIGSILSAYILNPQGKMHLRLIAIFINFVVLIEIYFSKAYQGLIVFLLGLSVSTFFWLKSKFESRKVLISYSACLVMVAFLGLLGILQRGPLASLLYKSSVSFRGAYWNAGIKMGLNNPFTGVGFDSYGDYYRVFRSARAMISPGPSVVTNTAHNVPIDLFAAGGFPLFLSYFCIMMLGIFAIIRIIKFQKKYDFVGTALVSIWLGYHLQSLVSINQIGLAVCGWAVTGALIGYSQLLKGSNKANNEKRIKTAIGPSIAAILGLAIGIPPFAVDAGWRSALNKGDGNAILKIADQWPRDTYRLTNIAFALEKSNLPDDAVRIARENVIFNPRSYDAWKLLVQISKSTPAEKNHAVEMLHKLDPLNTELK
jgi:O-antigen ligase